MRLVCLLFTFENNTGQTDLRTDGPTDGHDLLKRCDGASKNVFSSSEENRYMACVKDPSPSTLARRGKRKQCLKRRRKSPWWWSFVLSPTSTMPLQPFHFQTCLEGWGKDVAEKFFFWRKMHVVLFENSSERIRVRMCFVNPAEPITGSFACQIIVYSIHFFQTRFDNRLDPVFFPSNLFPGIEPKMSRKKPRSGLYSHTTLYPTFYLSHLIDSSDLVTSEIICV